MTVGCCVYLGPAGHSGQMPLPMSRPGRPNCGGCRTRHARPGRTGMRGGPSLGDGYCESRCGREALLGNNAYSSVRGGRAAAISSAAIEIERCTTWNRDSRVKLLTLGCITNCQSRCDVRGPAIAGGRRRGAVWPRLLRRAGWCWTICSAWMVSSTARVSRGSRPHSHREPAHTDGEPVRQ